MKFQHTLVTRNIVLYNTYCIVENVIGYERTYSIHKSVHTVADKSIRHKT